MVNEWFGTSGNDPYSEQLGDNYDVFYAKNGNDTITTWIDSNPNTIYAGNGDDSITGRSGQDRITRIIFSTLAGIMFPQKAPLA